MSLNKEKSQWKEEINFIHQKHLNNIQIDGVGELAFHYTSPSGLLGILSNTNIWFTDCDYLNDASESNYFYDLYSTIFNSFHLSRISSNLTFSAYLMAAFHSNDERTGRKFLSRESERRYVFSMSIDEDTLPLWNNYTKTLDSTGYNIGFNIMKLVESISLEDNQKIIFGRVIYNKDYQAKLLKELINDYLIIYKKYTYSYQRKYLYNAIENNILVYSIFMKDEAFKCENEFRVAILEKGDFPPDLIYREKNGAFIPFVKKSFDLKSISSIMVPPTTRADFVKQSVRSMTKHFKLENLEVKNSTIPLRY